jgi:ornithine cyclodeaminase
MIIVSETAIAALVTPDDAFAAVEAVFAAMARGDARNFPVIREALPGPEGALYGFKGGVDAIGGALGLKAGGYWPYNLERRGLINHQSTVFLFDPDSGKPTAMVAGNLLTALRTAAAAAVSVAHLARRDAKVLGIIGAGHQATFQLRQVAATRPFERVVAWNRTPDKLDRLRAVADELGLPFEVVSPEELGARSDVIVTIVSAHSPVLMDAHVRRGTHVACMGTDTKGKHEVEAALLTRAAIFTDEVAQSITIGEAQHAVGQGLIEKDAVAELGAVINGDHAGRASEDQITLFDGTGVGLQDLAVASAVVERAVATGVAVKVDF